MAGETVDARCDVYALGCVLYELVTGTRPFEGSPVVVMGKQLREQAEQPRSRAPHAIISPELEAVIMKALEKAKEDRFPTALAMREALEDALVAPDRRRSRSRRLVGAAVVLSMALIGVAGLKDRSYRGIFGAKAPVVSVATVNVGELPNANAEANANANANANAEANAEAPTPVAAVVLAPAPAPAPAAAPAPPAALVAVEEPKSPAPREAHKDDRREDPHARKPSGLLVRATARSVDKSDDARTRLGDARTIAREHPTDPHALKAWAMAAMHFGEMREARRAAEAWAVHDASAEPRLFLAAALESTGRKREARAVLEEWLANHPESPEAKRMLSRLGGATSPPDPQPAIKRSGRTRGAGRVQLHPPDPVAADE